MPRNTHQTIQRDKIYMPDIGGNALQDRRTSMEPTSQSNVPSRKLLPQIKIIERSKGSSSVTR